MNDRWQRLVTTDPPDWMFEVLTERQMDGTSNRFKWRLLLNKAGLSSRAKLIGHVLESHCHNDELGYQLGAGVLATEAGVSRDTVVRAVRELEKAELIAVRREKDARDLNQRNRYWLRWPSCQRYVEASPVKKRRTTSAKFSAS